MKVAFSIWNERIAPVFDVSRQAIILDIEKEKIIERREEAIPNSDLFSKLERLVNLKVQTLVCGAISRPLADMAATSGIEVIPFIAGDVEKVIKAFTAGSLPNPDLAMPGCCERRERYRSGRCWRQGKDPNEIINGKHPRNYERRQVMPRGDGTGPQGKGPGTGKGMGRCGVKGTQRPTGQPGQGPGSGMGQGRRSGSGRKRKK